MGLGAPLVPFHQRRRIPVIRRLHQASRRRNDSVIDAIAEVIRDAMTADGHTKSGDEDPDGRGSRMVDLLKLANPDDDRCSSTSGA